MEVGWYQFSVGQQVDKGKYYPTITLYTFLPDFIYINKGLIENWHYLFEPSTLIRFSSKYPELVWASAELIAKGYGLVITKGDIEESSPVKDGNNWEWPGEEAKYGKDLWPSMIKFLQANSEIGIASNKYLEPEELPIFSEKYIHLLLNSLGNNTAEEVVICSNWADKATEMYLKKGRK